ncbi:zinc finger protein CONSTANS-like isoform X1 [Gossypium australe]|uniref:Zinc finger protein CONSTANS-like isoform X1 n=1 Tax=Gossypium australe TaxID=47621 RepID=A0A5B6UHE6_9ROSI|nr:zinc finger protein CONSTANS-like isoform X1 [Gossypium australe]
MYGQPTFPRSSSEFLSDSLTSPDVVSLPLNFPLSPQTQLTVAKSVESVSDVIHSGSSSSGSFNSPTSLASCCTHKPSFIRSFSSHSLPKNEFHCRFASSLNDFIDSDSAPVRRVFSTGDLHQVQQSGRKAESPLSNESSAIIEGMSRACRYSPEEKKQRIQRYRTKRKLRNFNKKIKYACRKTLADSRPRIRGRFIRNTEIEKIDPQVEWSHIADGEEDDEMNWISFLDIHSHQLLINP